MKFKVAISILLVCIAVPGFLLAFVFFVNCVDSSLPLHGLPLPLDQPAAEALLKAKGYFRDDGTIAIRAAIASDPSIAASHQLAEWPSSKTLSILVLLVVVMWGVSAAAICLVVGLAMLEIRRIYRASTR